SRETAASRGSTSRRSTRPPTPPTAAPCASQPCSCSRPRRGSLCVCAKRGDRPLRKYLPLEPRETCFHTLRHARSEHHLSGVRVGIGDEVRGEGAALDRSERELVERLRTLSPVRILWRHHTFGRDKPMRFDRLDDDSREAEALAGLVILPLASQLSARCSTRDAYRQ